MKIVVKKYEAIIFAAAVIAAFVGVADVRRGEVAAVYSANVVEDDVFPAAGRVALTFDDGPHPAHTSVLTAALGKHGVAATFYLVGKQVEKYPDIAASIAAAGFEIGGHTYSHDNLTFLDESRVIYELEKTRLLLKRHASTDTYFFRPPGGRHDARVRDIAARMGYTMVLWDVLPRDHEDISAGDIARRVVDGVRRNKGGIVILHSGLPRTVEALETIIPALRAEGYEFATVSRFLAARGTDNNAALARDSR